MSFHQFMKSLGFALIGWAFCGIIMGLGPRFMSMENTLIVHLILGPAAFGVLCRLYYRNGGNTRPFITAVTWTLVILLLDAGIIAPLIEKSNAMLHSLIGFWIPISLIFIVTYTIGNLSVRRHSKF